MGETRGTHVEASRISRNPIEEKVALTEISLSRDFFYRGEL